MDQEGIPVLRFTSHRSPVYGCGGMVAANQPLAVAAGVEILKSGGSAADAAIAAAAALAVTEPCSTGLGGDAFALYFSAADHSIHALNGSGRAARALSIERLQQEGWQDALPPRHPYTVTVPGACAAWHDLVKRFGRLRLATILQPAIRLAEEGFPVSPITAAAWQRDTAGALLNSYNGVELTLQGRAPLPGEIFRNPGLARTLKVIAGSGKEAFYCGEIAAAIVAAIHHAGGVLSREDLASHTSTWEQPISTTYRGMRIWECPPNGQGLVALLALNILEGFDLPSLPPLSPKRLHLLIEALRLAFADGRYFIADPLSAPAPLEILLSKDYAAQRRRQIDPQRAGQAFEHGLLAAGSDTVYLSVVDGEGNACSFINSIYTSFGTGIVPPGWGFCLQNRGLNFSLQPGHPNALAPGKRPYHTIIPALATYEESSALYASFGVMGGFMQPQGHVQTTIALLDDHLNPQEALDQLRLCLEVNQAKPTVALEEGIPAETAAALEEMGHPLRLVRGLERSLFGRGQIICRDPKSGVLCGGSDPRGDGCAMAFS